MSMFDRIVFLSATCLSVGLTSVACQSAVVSSASEPLSSDLVDAAQENRSVEAIADASTMTLFSSDMEQTMQSSWDDPVDAKGEETHFDVGSGEKNVASERNSPALDLARHLTDSGAKMYGAYWCPHCQEQKKTFGDAFHEVDYVECDPGGENPRTQLCLDANIEAFPTWIIDGEHHLGVHSLQELATLSGYEGEV